MFCPSCGTEIPGNSRYCLVCGKSPSATVASTKRSSVREEPEEQSHTLRNVLIGAVVLVIALIVLGPDGIVKAARNLGKTIRKVIRSPIWSMMLDTQRELREMPRVGKGDQGGKVSGLP